MLEYVALYIALCGEKLLKFTESFTTTSRALWCCSRHLWALGHSFVPGWASLSFARLRRSLPGYIPPPRHRPFLQEVPDEARTEQGGYWHPIAFRRLAEERRLALPPAPQPSSSSHHGNPL